MTIEPADHGLLLIDRRLPVPLYHQIAVTVHNAIRAGHFPPASALPPEPALAQQLRVCRPTVHAAMTALFDAGIIERLQASTGSGVARPRWQVCDRAAKEGIAPTHPTAAGSSPTRATPPIMIGSGPAR